MKASPDQASSWSSTKENTKSARSLLPYPINLSTVIIHS
jgi:hypothetical protein